MSMAMRGVRAAAAALLARRRQPGAREDDLELRLDEPNHPNHITVKYLWRRFKSLPEDVPLHRMMCVSTVVAYVGALAELRTKNVIAIYVNAIMIVYESLYALTSLARLNNFMIRTFEKDLDDLTYERNFLFSFIVDLTSFTHHFANELPDHLTFKVNLFCLLMRLHRPLGYLINQMTHYMDGSAIGVLIKYYFYSVMTRLLLIVFFMLADEFLHHHLDLAKGHIDKSHIDVFHFYAIYVNWDYMAMGKQYKPKTLLEFLLSLVFVVTGFQVRMLSIAALAQAFSVHLLAAEQFAARRRLMREDMKYTKVPYALYEKVETFYHMYWSRQRAVSRPRLLAVYPRPLAAAVVAEVYFEAQQQNPVLRDLSSQFLMEVAMAMRTACFLPGDTVVARGARRHTAYYLHLGDVLILSAEDDSTALLRLSRGSAINPLGVCAALAATKAHVEVRAATYCVVHSLRALDFWRVAARHGRAAGQTAKVISTFKIIIRKIKKYHEKRAKHNTKFKSSIVQMKRSLMALKRARAADGRPLLPREDYMLEVAGTYRIRNHEDLTLTKEIDESCLRATFPFILEPRSSLLQCWDCAVAALVAVVCVTHPYYIVFCKDRSMMFKVFDHAVTGVYLLDIFIFLSTAVDVEEGVPLTFAATAAQRAAEPWLAVDVLAAAPVFEFIGAGDYAGINKVLSLHKVFKVLSRLAAASTAEPTATHAAICCMCVIIAAYGLGSVQQTFMCQGYGRCVVTNHSVDLSSYWLPGPLDEDNVWSRVFYSMYWALSVLGFLIVRTQNFKPYLWSTVVYTTVVMEFAMCFHLLIYSLYGALTIAHQTMRITYTSSLVKINILLNNNRITERFRMRLLEYLQLCWYMDKAYSMNNKRSFYYDLPPHVFKELVTKKHSKFLLTLPFVKAMSRERQRSISTGAVVFYTTPREILLRTGDVSKEFYIIKEGFCELIDPYTLEVRPLNPMDSFGVLESIFDIPTYYSVRSVTNVCLISIHNTHFKGFFSIPSIMKIVNEVKETKEFSKLMIRHNQFLSYRTLEKPPNRQKFVLPRKFESDAAFLEPFKSLGFFSLVRYICPRWTLRPDGVYLERYELFRGVCVLFNAFFYPNYYALSLERPSIRYLHYISTTLTYLDMVQRLLTGYYDERGVLVSHPASTGQHYIRNAFLADLLAGLPLEVLEDGEDRGMSVLIGGMTESAVDDSYTPPEIRHLLFCNRLLQLYRLRGALQILRHCFSRPEMITYFNALIMMSVLSCVMGMFMVFAGYDLVKKEGTWYLDAKAPRAGNLSWELLIQDQVYYTVNASIANVQLTIFFWTFTEILYSGFFHFYTDTHRQPIFLVVGMLLGMVIKIFFTVMVMAASSHGNRELAAHREQYEDLMRFMTRERLDPELIDMISGYYIFNWEKLHGLDYHKVLAQCEHIALRAGVINCLYGPTFDKCPVFQGGWPSLMRALGRSVQGRFYTSGFVIVEADDCLRSIFVLDSGTIDVCDPYEDYEVIDVLTIGSMFGNLRAGGYRRFPYRLTSRGTVHLLRLRAADTHEAIAGFPEHHARMQKVIADNEHYLLGRVSANASKLASLRHVMGKDRIRTGPLFVRLFSIDNHWFAGLVVVSGMVCPYGDLHNAVFHNNGAGLLAALYLADLLFFVTVIINIVKPYAVEDARLKILTQEERRRYINSEFKYEIVSCLPLELFSLAAAPARGWSWFAVLRLNRLLRILTVLKTLSFHRERLGSNMMAAIGLWMLVTLSILIHMFTCCWCALGIYEEAAHNQSWITYMRYITKPNCGTTYSCALFFSTRTFFSCNHASLLPTTQYEIMLLVGYQLMCWVLSMLYVGQFCRIIKTMMSRSFDFYYILKELQNFMHDRGLSPNLQCLLSRYALLLWRKSRGLQLPACIFSAPAIIRKMVLSAAYQHHLLQHPVFMYCEISFLKQMCEYFFPYRYCEDMYIVRKNEITNTIYFVHEGRARAICDDGTRGEVYSKGQYFGTKQGLLLDLPFTNSYRAMGNCTILTLTFDKWQYLLGLFPESRDIIYRNMPEMHTYRPIFKPKPPPPPPPDSEAAMPQLISKTSSTMLDITSKATPTALTIESKVSLHEDDEELPPTDGRRRTIFRKILDTFGTTTATNEPTEPGGPHRRRTFLQILTDAFQGKEETDAEAQYPTQRRKTLFQKAFGNDQEEESQTPQLGRRKTFFGKVKIGDDETRLRFADRDTLLIQEELATLDSYVDDDFDFEEIGPGVEDDDYQDDVVIKEHKKEKIKKLTVRESEEKSDFPFPFRDKKKRQPLKKKSIQDKLKYLEEQDGVLEDKGEAEIKHEEKGGSKEEIDKLEKDQLVEKHVEKENEIEDQIEKTDRIQDDDKIYEVEKDDLKIESSEDQIHEDKITEDEINEIGVEGKDTVPSFDKKSVPLVTEKDEINVEPVKDKKDDTKEIIANQIISVLIDDLINSVIQSSVVNMESTYKKDDVEEIDVDQIAFATMDEVLDEVLKSEIRDDEVNVESIDNKTDVAGGIDVDQVVSPIIDQVIDEVMKYKIYSDRVNIERFEDKKDYVAKIDVDQNTIFPIIDEGVNIERMEDKKDYVEEIDVVKNIIKPIIDEVVADEVKSDSHSSEYYVKAIEDKDVAEVIDVGQKMVKHSSEVKVEPIKDTTDDENETNATTIRRKSMFQRMTQKLIRKKKTENDIDDDVDLEPFDNVLEHFKIVDIDQDLLQKDREEIDKAHSELHRPSTSHRKSRLQFTENEDEDDDELGEFDPDIDIEDYLQKGKGKGKPYTKQDDDAEPARRERRMTHFQFAQDDEVDDDDDDNDDEKDTTIKRHKGLG